MRKKHWIIIFFALVAAEMTGIQLENEIIQFICKPLLMPVLGAHLFSKTADTNSRLRAWLVVALFFSWAGDVLLLFQENASIFFLLGLSAFLLAHICYIGFFHSVRVKENVKSNLWLLLVVVIYYAVLISILSPFLGPMKLPVRVYGIVISFMFMLAMHMLFIQQKKAGRWMMWGALLFVISDSALAINKFYLPFEGAGLVIILTYGLAQLFIIEGGIRYLRSLNSN